MAEEEEGGCDDDDDRDNENTIIRTSPIQQQISDIPNILRLRLAISSNWFLQYGQLALLCQGSAPCASPPATYGHDAATGYPTNTDACSSFSYSPCKCNSSTAKTGFSNHSLSGSSKWVSPGDRWRLRRRFMWVAWRLMSPTQVYDLFNQVGQVASVRVCRDLTTRQSLGNAG